VEEKKSPEQSELWSEKRDALLGEGGPVGTKGASEGRGKKLPSSSRKKSTKTGCGRGETLKERTDCGEGSRTQAPGRLDAASRRIPEPKKETGKGDRESTESWRRREACLLVETEAIFPSIRERFIGGKKSRGEIRSKGVDVDWKGKRKKTNMPKRQPRKSLFKGNINTPGGEGGWRGRVDYV